jgi:ADP-ribose pyrophosphatase
MDYEVLQSELAFRGKVFDVRTDQVRTPSGLTMRVDVIEHAGAVTLVPLDDKGRILFVRQYRHPAGQWLLELPAGTLEKDEAVEECAERECREETGMAAGQLTPLGNCYVAPGYSSELNHLFLARDLTPAPLPPDVDEDLAVVPMTLQDVGAAVASGELIDAKSLAGLYLASGYLKTAGIETGSAD